MTLTVNDVPIYYEQYGDGKPVLCIHGYTVDHRLMSGCLESVFTSLADYKRIYVDLPGMGRTPGTTQVKSAHDVLELLCRFISKLMPNESFLLVGESFGGYLALGLIFEMGEKIDGVLLVCPQTKTWRVKETWQLPTRQMIYKSEDLDTTDDPDLKEFMQVAVIATPEIYARYKNDILPGIKLADNDFLFNYFDGGYNSNFEAALKTMEFNAPVCILTGRQDNLVGYLDSFELLRLFPRATYAVLDCAGHNLQTESEPLFSQFLKDWIWRVELKCKMQL